MISEKKIGFIGGGQMGGAIYSGMIASGKVKGENVLVADPHPDRLAKAHEVYGVKTFVNDKTTNAAVKKMIPEADILVLAIKPQFARELMMEVKEVIRKDQLIISIMGGVTLDSLNEYLPENPILRVMPNTPMMVRKGVAGIAANHNATQEHRDLGVEMFDLVGKSYLLPENLIDPLTSVSGCSPAFAYLFIEAMADGGVEKGLPRQMALELAAQALAGSAEMVLQTGKHPGQLKDDVCSPGGSTIVGVHALERGNFRATVMNAITESCDKMIEVGKKA